jgi:hypothetical protein
MALTLLEQNRDELPSYCSVGKPAITQESMDSRENGPLRKKEGGDSTGLSPQADGGAPGTVPSRNAARGHSSFFGQEKEEEGMSTHLTGNNTAAQLKIITLEDFFQSIFIYSKFKQLFCKKY